MCKKIIQVENISKSYKNFDNSFTNVLTDISFDILMNSTTILCGKNGVGKSLLVKIIAGIEKSDSGNISYKLGKNSIGIVFGNAAESILGDTAYNDVVISLKISGCSNKNLKEQAEKILQQVGLFEKRHRPSFCLSSGEQKRLSIASVLALNKNIIFLDEPYSNLDYPGVIEVNRLIKELQADNKTIIIISHELEKCTALAEKMLIIDNGRIVYNGKPSVEVLSGIEKYGIRNPLIVKNNIEELVWL